MQQKLQYILRNGATWSSGVMDWHDSLVALCSSPLQCSPVRLLQVHAWRVSVSDGDLGVDRRGALGSGLLAPFDGVAP